MNSDLQPIDLDPATLERLERLGIRVYRKALRDSPAGGSSASDGTSAGEVILNPRVIRRYFPAQITVR